MTSKYHLNISCPDQRGIIAAVSSFIAQHNGSILKSDNFRENSQHRFFIRVEISKPSLSISMTEFKQQFEVIAKKFNMTWAFRDASIKKKLLILVSKTSHCMEDLLYRWQSGQLDGDIAGVFSNHNELADRVEWYGVPFYSEPIINNNKEKHFQRLTSLIKTLNIDVIVLARYMQILPADLCKSYGNHLINIHHGFLPSFSGANPYQQAFDKGVKIIGATSHFVTSELDEGPIIEQSTAPISHRLDVNQLKQLGKDIERTVLAKAVEAFLEDRVFLCENKTIVFRD